MESWIAAGGWHAESARIAQLFYLLLPVYLANMAPPLTRFWHGWNPPISRRWLGSHKTVLGFALGVAVAMVVACLQSRLQWHYQLLDYRQPLLFGAACGVGALGGDSLKSFFKRRLGIAPGRPWIPADQLDFVIGGVLVVSCWVAFTARDLAYIFVLSFIGDIIVNHLAFYCRIRDTKW